jgi:hypothetical protein
VLGGCETADLFESDLNLPPGNPDLLGRGLTALSASDGYKADALTAFLLFGLQSAVIFLNKFFDLICDPKKF